MAIAYRDKVLVQGRNPKRVMAVLEPLIAQPLRLFAEVEAPTSVMGKLLAGAIRDRRAEQGDHEAGSDQPSTARH